MGSEITYHEITPVVRYVVQDEYEYYTYRLPNPGEDHTGFYWHWWTMTPHPLGFIYTNAGGMYIPRELFV